MDIPKGLTHISQDAIEGQNMVPNISTLVRCYRKRAHASKATRTTNKGTSTELMFGLTFNITVLMRCNLSLTVRRVITEGIYFT